MGLTAGSPVAHPLTSPAASRGAGGACAGAPPALRGGQKAFSLSASGSARARTARGCAGGAPPRPRCCCFWRVSG